LRLLILVARKGFLKDNVAREPKSLSTTGVGYGRENVIQYNGKPCTASNVQIISVVNKILCTRWYILAFCVAQMTRLSQMTEQVQLMFTVKKVD